MSAIPLLVNVLIAGISFGAIYAMMAIGFSLLWQTSRTVNFAQGDFATLPAFIMVGLTANLRFPLSVAIAVAVVASVALFGYAFRATIVARLLGRGLLAVVIATFAVSTTIENGLAALWTPLPLPAPSLVPGGSLHLGAITLDLQALENLAIATAMIIALELFLNRTRTGVALLATAQNAPVARMLGIDTRRMITYSFVINAVLVSVSGLLLAHIYFVQWNNGLQLGLFAFYAVIIGGINNLRGALAGGLIVGVANAVFASYVSSVWASGLLVLLLIFIILVRPQGLFGRQELVREFTA